jgi:hypothetical protein
LESSAPALLAEAFKGVCTVSEFLTRQRYGLFSAKVYPSGQCLAIRLGCCGEAAVP